MPAFSIKKMFCGAAIGAALLLCIVDFITSYKGISTFIPQDNRSIVLKMVPLIFAILAISINSISAWLFRMLDHQQHTEFTKSFLAMVFLGFLTYDGVSSFLGMLAEFYGQKLSTVQGIFEAYHSIGVACGILSAIVAILASFSPLLTSMFWDLYQDMAAEEQQLATERR